MSTLRRFLVALAVLVLTSVGLLAAATPAQAVDYYRYWSYFHLVDGGYDYSDQGVGQYQPQEGSIEAFRFAATAESSVNKPRVDPTVATFDAICGDEDAESGHKRVAVIVDYGLDSDSAGQAVPTPEAECADVPTDATTLQVLQDATDAVRTESSSLGPQLCAIDGYPASGCGTKTTKVTPDDSGYVSVALDTATGSATDSATGSPTGSASDSASAAPSDLPQGPAQDNDQDTEQGRGANPVRYFGLGVVLFAIVGGGIYLARRRRAE